MTSIKKGPIKGPFLIDLVRPERFELPTARFVAEYSIQLSYGRMLETQGRALCEAQPRPVKNNYRNNGGERGRSRICDTQGCVNAAGDKMSGAATARH